MTDPSSPNYKPGVGRLVTDRFDFQKHVDGTAFNHKSSGIELFPTVVINGSPRNNVQTAIEQLALNLTPPVVPDATSTVKGIIKLTGDIGGSATNILVTRIQGKPISGLAPTVNDLLYWSGTAWTPSGTITLNTLTATTVDATTSNIINNNMSIGTVTNKISFTGAGFMEFASNNINPTIICQNAVTGNGADFGISGQGTNDVSGNGGNIFLTAGGTSGPLGGSVLMQGGPGTLSGGIAGALGEGSVMFSATQVDADRRVFGLLSTSIVDSSLMPANSGDMVVYLGDANTNPSAAPVSGSVLYSTGGTLHVRQADNTDITIGMATNPDIWGSVVSGNQTNPDGEVYRFRKILTSVDALGTAFNVPLAIPNHCAAAVNVWITAKQDSPQVHLAYFKMSAAFSNEGGLTEANVPDNNTDGYLPFPPYTEHARFDTGAAFWTSKPTIGTSGTSVRILTGGNSSTTITWFIIVEMMICPSFSAP